MPLIGKDCNRATQPRRRSSAIDAATARHVVTAWLPKLLVVLVWNAFAFEASARTAPAQAVAKNPSVTIRGRILDKQGHPVEGALVELNVGWGNRKAVHANSRGDGCFEVSERTASGVVFPATLHVTHEDFARIGFRWEELQAGRTIDLGDQELARPAVLRGFLVDTWGQLLIEGWRVTAAERGSPGEGRVRQESAPVTIDPENGTFVIDDLGPGWLRVTASGPQAETISETILTRSDRTNEIRMARGGQIVSRHVYARIKPVYGTAPAAGTVRAIAADGTSYVLKRIASGQLWRTAVLAPGMYSLVVDDPRFGLEKLAGVKNGEKTRVRLSGSVNVRLNVVDAADGTQIEGVGVSLAYVSESTLGDDSPHAWVQVHPRAGRLRGLVPGDLELELSAPGYETARFQVEALTPGEGRELTLPLERGPTLTGRVLWSDGSAATKLIVQAVPVSPESPEVDSEATWVFYGNQTADQVSGTRAQIDADGRFTFTHLTPGRYAVRAQPVRWGYAERIAEIGPDSGEFELRLPPFGAANIGVLLPQGVSVEGLSIEGHRADRSADSERGPDCRLPLGPNATSSFYSLPVGEYEFELVVDFVDHGVLVAPNRTTRLPLGATIVDEHAVAQIRFDVTETFPCRGTVDVWAGNGRARPVFLLRERSPELGPTEPFQVSGQGLWGFAPAGRYWVEAVDVRGGWTWRAPEPIDTEPGERFAVEYTVPFVETEVRVTTGGKPLIGAPVTWWTEALEDHLDRQEDAVWRLSSNGRFVNALSRDSSRDVTDELGVIGPLRLPPNTYFFAPAGEPERAVELRIETDGRLELVLPESSR